MIREREVRVLPGGLMLLALLALDAALVYALVVNIRSPWPAVLLSLAIAIAVMNRKELSYASE